MQHQGAFEKFNSKPLVLTFNATDVDLVITPTRIISSRNKINGFDKKPAVKIENMAGEKIDFHQAILPAGSGISRDYEKEVAKYNQKNNFKISLSAPEDVYLTDVNGKKTIVPVVIKKASKMIETLYVKASSVEKEQFTDWAFKNRKSIETPLNGEGKILPMLEYWYEKATSDEKAEILTWVLAQ